MTNCKMTEKSSARILHSANKTFVYLLKFVSNDTFFFKVTGVPLKFREEPSPSVGRIKVYHNSSWSPVCRQKWGDYESLALCEVLGYNGTESDPCENANNCVKNNTATQQCTDVNTMTANCSVQEEVPVIACKGILFEQLIGLFSLCVTRFFWHKYRYHMAKVKIIFFSLNIWKLC